MKQVFQSILDMSLSGSLIILVLLFLRLFPRKYPKWGDVALWGLAGLRLMIPFHIESQFSLLPGRGKFIASSADPIPVTNPQELPVSGVTHLDIVNVMSYVWLAGVLLMLIYFMVNYFKVKRKFDSAVHLQDRIYQSEFATTPVVIGYFRPAIYIPYRVDARCMDAIISHEQNHIRRGDHWWKLLAFLCLSIHWFNPLVWLAYACFGQDIELACDEAVIRKLDQEGRAEYAEALVRYSAKSRLFSAAPTAFGGASPQKRVKAIVQYRNPSKPMMLLLAVCGAALTLCFLTEPVTASAMPVPNTPEAQPEEMTLPTTAPHSELDYEQEAVRLQIEFMEKELDYLKLQLKQANQQYETVDKQFRKPLKDQIDLYQKQITELESHIQSAKQQIGLE